MRSPEEFKAFLKGDFSQILSILEEKRIALLRYFFKIFILGASIAITSVILGVSGFNPLLTGLILTTVFFILIFFILRRYSDYKRKYKEQLIGNIVKFFDDSLTYSPFGYIPENKFLASNIFSIKPDRYSGSDYVSGKIGQTEIEFSYICAEYKSETTSHDSNGHSNREEYWHTIFKGIFFIADFNKHFSSQVLLWPDGSGRFLKAIKKKLAYFSKWQVINLEDPEFEKYYIAYGTDQVEARYILSTSLMRRIIDYRKKVKRKVYISFKDSLMYIGISGNFSFKTSLFSSVKNYSRLTEIYDILSMIISIVEEFSLNTRIWSKQPHLPASLKKLLPDS